MENNHTFSLFPPGIPISKRIFDLICTSIGLVIISPILAITSVAIWKRLGRPIIFSQLRPGYKGKPFWLYKFRTMTDQRNNQGDLLPDSKRITGLGRFLRNSSIDELPELWCVLRGDMSLVGPRPLLMQYLERYSSEQARRHNVIPGMTGWAQINGRNILNWEDKFKLDVWYVDNWTFWLDIRILFSTMLKVIKREGISQPGFLTAEEFMGSNPPEETTEMRSIMNESNQKAHR